MSDYRAFLAGEMPSRTWQGIAVRNLEGVRAQQHLPMFGAESMA